MCVETREKTTTQLHLSISKSIIITFKLILLKLHITAFQYKTQQIVVSSCILLRISYCVRRNLLSSWLFGAVLKVSSLPAGLSERSACYAQIPIPGAS
jgi:hypothetical protein